MLLYLGSKPTVVVSSSKGAEAIMKTHDIIFANRPKSQVAFLILYNGMDIAFGKYGEFWRNLKSICVLNMFSNKKVLSFRKIREEEVSVMVEDIRKSTPEASINLSDSLTRLTTGVVLRVTFGSRNYGVDVGELVSEFSEVLGAFSVGDFIPWLSWIDELRGVLPKARKVAKELDTFIQNRVDEHIVRLGSQNHDIVGNKGEKIEDFVDVLLEIQRNDPSLQMNSLKVIIMLLKLTQVSLTNHESA
ncbi:cytochrome P450 71A4-like [Silene latifolia]|uniref:cytochrome P450 71A4-like n=1 Tax=Silene latifolia TaxID=37657 RepID=UPI003D76BB10